MALFIERKKLKVDEYLLKIRQGDSSALAPLYEITSKPLYALCYTFFRNKESSEDALSDTYLTAIRSIDKYRGSNGFNWLYTICKNLCINAVQKNKWSVSIDLTDEQTVNLIGSKDSTPTLNDESGIIALSEKTLNPTEFQIVILHAVNAMKFKEIAKTVGGKESTVRWQYNNAIKKVKVAYERRSNNEE